VIKGQEHRGKEMEQVNDDVLGQVHLKGISWCKGLASPSGAL
jgi:hypothetical protein